MTHIRRLIGVKPYAKSGGEGIHTSLRKRPPLDAYTRYQLDLARERVEEEIIASDFVRGAWRDLRKRKGAA